MRNVFENNNPPETDPEDLEEMVVAVLPHVREGYRYSLKDLPNGDVAVEVVENELKAEDLNSPESRTLRHRD